MDIYNVEKQLKDFLTGNQLEDRVIFCGEVQNVQEYLQASDIFVFPTQKEAFGISAIEAMACGLPVITTSVGGLRDILVHEQNGLVVQQDCEEDLYKALNRLISDKGLAEALGKSALQTAQGAGVKASVLSGYGNDGLIKGPVWEDGISGNALRFDGKHDYILIEDKFPLDGLTDNSFTFSARVRPEDRPKGRNPYAILVRGSARPDSYFGLSYNEEGKYQAQIITADENFHVLTSLPFEPKIWHHLAMVVDADSNLLHLYIDGEPVNDSPLRYSGEMMNLGIKDLENYFFGEYYIGSTKPDLGGGSFFTKHFKGLIEDVKMYNQALDEAEIYCLAFGC